MSTNFETCKRIAEELEAIANGNIYICPECGEAVQPVERENEVHYCPECNTEMPEDDSQLYYSLYNYFNDCLDIEYRIRGDGQYKSVCIMVACGGPNIYIDTSSKAVELYWCGDNAKCPLSYDTTNIIDDHFEELWNCR